MMQPWIRKYNYISDYYKTLYELYTNEYPAYPVNYYSVDYENSILDKEILMGGTYEKNGLGALSGMKFKKIFLLPVGNIEQITPNQDATERGVSFEDSMYSSFTIPTEYGLVPIENDIVHFSQEFMGKSIDLDPIFLVTNINKATYGDISVYQCQLKITGSTLVQVEQQISSFHMFMEFSKKIHPIENAELLLGLESIHESLSVVANNSFNNLTGFYLG